MDPYEAGVHSRDMLVVSSEADNNRSVESLFRAELSHGRIPFTTVALRTERERWIGFDARYVYSSGYRNSTLLEDLTVPDPAANASTVRETFVVGDADRKQSSGDFTVVLLPTPRRTFTITTSVHHT